MPKGVPKKYKPDNRPNALAWQKCHEDFIRENAYKMKDSEMALMLSEITGKYITTWAVTRRRISLNIPKWHGRGDNYKWAGPNHNKDKEES